MGHVVHVADVVQLVPLFTQIVPTAFVPLSVNAHDVEPGAEAEHVALPCMTVPSVPCVQSTVAVKLYQHAEPPAIHPVSVRIWVSVGDAGVEATGHGPVDGQSPDTTRMLNVKLPPPLFDCRYHDPDTVPGGKQLGARTNGPDVV